MRPTPINREIIDRAIDEYGIIDYANATIREVKAIAERAERESGKEFIKMEMGIPGLPAAKIGVEAQIKALQNGCARLYPALPGEPMIKDATSRFIKAFIDIDIPAECCIPTVGSMQGTFASLLTITQSKGYLCLVAHHHPEQQEEEQGPVHRPRFPRAEVAVGDPGCPL